MPAATTFIRIPNGDWQDLYDYGVSLSETAVSKLMTPAPNKDHTENESALQHGKRVMRDTTAVKKKERNISLELNIYGKNQTDFLYNYGNFCNNILDKGFFDIKTIYVPNTVYRLTYLDCTQFEEFRLELGKFVLNVNEPDPTNRGVNSTDEWRDLEPEK